MKIEEPLLPPDIENGSETPSYGTEYHSGRTEREGRSERMDACQVCYNAEEPGDDNSALKVMAACEHRFCGYCLEGHFRSLIMEQGRYEDLVCPMWGCKQKPDIEEVRALIGEATFQKYLDFNRNTRVIKDRNLQFCKTVNCTGILDKKGAVGKKVTCGTCKQDFCLSCKGKHHPGAKCNFSSKKEYLGWVSRQDHVYFCPKCNCQIVKEGGCPNMRCSVCKFSFCWVCSTHSENLWVHVGMMGFLFCGMANEALAVLSKVNSRIGRLLLAILMTLGVLTFPAFCLVAAACYYAIGGLVLFVVVLLCQTPEQKDLLRKKSYCLLAIGTPIFLLLVFPVGAVLALVLGAASCLLLTAYYYFALTLWSTYILLYTLMNILTGRKYDTNQAH